MRECKSDEIIGHELTLSIFRKKEKRRIDVHTHDFIEIIYILAGEGVEYINDQPIAVNRGDLLFINYGSKHFFSPHEYLDYVNICFHPELVGQNIITRENAFALLELTAIDEIQKAEEIAERSGFSSASAFYRTYAKARGESFSSYRRKKKPKDPAR